MEHTEVTAMSSLRQQAFLVLIIMLTFTSLETGLCMGRYCDMTYLVISSVLGSLLSGRLILASAGSISSSVPHP